MASRCVDYDQQGIPQGDIEDVTMRIREDWMRALESNIMAALESQCMVSDINDLELSQYTEFTCVATFRGGRYIGVMDTTNIHLTPPVQGPETFRRSPRGVVARALQHCRSSFGIGNCETQFCNAVETCVSWGNASLKVKVSSVTSVWSVVIPVSYSCTPDYPGTRINFF